MCRSYTLLCAVRKYPGMHRTQHDVAPGVPASGMPARPIASDARRVVRKLWQILLIGHVLLIGVGLATHGERSTLRAQEKIFRAGVYAIDITPLELPVIINGGMSERVADKITDRLHARCFVLDDGQQQIAIAVVDSCMMPRALLDEAKRMASAATGIPSERMLISATHTHSAPSVMGCLGSDVDERYAAFLPGQIAKGIKLAFEHRVPARVGWAVGRDEKNVACRRWLMKPGTAPTNPFGGTRNDQAMMHPGFNNPNAIRPTGPVDPAVTILALQTRDGKPLGLLANYSMHYVGATPVSADYFAVFCQKIAERLAVAADQQPAFMAALSNGTSGDTWLMDYSKPMRREYSLESVATDVADAAWQAYQSITFHDWVPLDMKERRLTLAVRMPGEEEVKEAREFMKTFEGRKPTTVPEVYARETVLLSQMPPTRELKLQALRVGDLAITAIPNEVFASTGLWIKEHSPFPITMNISLANGAEGYIPPPDQHALGGYTTWRARTSCLEIHAEPKIREAVLELLQQLHRQDKS